jgi:hypothetical protein
VHCVHVVRLFFDTAWAHCCCDEMVVPCVVEIERKRVVLYLIVGDSCNVVQTFESHLPIQNTLKACTSYMYPIHLLLGQ